jgi:hypothetical protein
MTDASIYQFVADKLITHGVRNTEDGMRVLNDQKLFSFFVQLERAVRVSSFDAVQKSALEIENYLISIKKRQVMAFVYLYIRFSEFTPIQTVLDEELPDGRIRTSQVFSRRVTDEERLIGLWAKVKYQQVGERFLQVVYDES